MKKFFAVFMVLSLFVAPAMAREFWVCEPDDANYQDLYKKIGTKYYWDGVPKLYSTISGALSSCVTNRGDVIYVDGSFSETALTQAINLNKNDVSLIGVGASKPTLGCSRNNAAMTITAARVLVDNFRIDIPDVDDTSSAIFIEGSTEAAPHDQITVRNIDIEVGDATYSYADVIILGSANDAVSEVTLENINMFGQMDSGTCPACLIDIQGYVSDTVIKGIKAYDLYVGTAGLCDDVTAANIALIDNVVVVTGTTKRAAYLNSTPSGIAVNNMWGSSQATIAEVANLGNYIKRFKNYVLETQTGLAQGSSIIPPLDTD